MAGSNENNEDFFKEVVRRFLAAGRYPANNALLEAAGRPGDKVAFGLTTAQTRWRIEEIEAAGFDWQASKQARQLVRRSGGRTD
jgi:hypothetical protein